MPIQSSHLHQIVLSLARLLLTELLHLLQKSCEVFYGDNLIELRCQLNTLLQRLYVPRIRAHKDALCTWDRHRAALARIGPFAPIAGRALSLSARQKAEGLGGRFRVVVHASLRLRRRGESAPRQQGSCQQYRSPDCHS